MRVRSVKPLLVLLLCVCMHNIHAQNDNVQVQYFQVANDTAYAEEQASALQNEKRDKILSRIGVGGTLGLQVGSYTNIELSPEITYHFNKWVCLGIGGTYMFSHYRTTNMEYNSHVFGARGFVEAHFFNYIALHAEYQWLNYKLYGEDDRTYSHNILLGGGFYQTAGRMAYYILLFYNISDKQFPDNVLSDFVTRAGIVVFLK
ncbi:MAG: hypothetical protein J5701_02270 [Bacteroidales bacterium]|nr:hypothetical protein [Bacteroidales bacterium]